MASSGRPRDVWKSSAPARPPGAGPGRDAGRGRWFAAALVVVMLGGAIAGLLFYLWSDPPPVVLAIPVTAYDQPDWPPNAWAEDDARAVLGQTKNDGAQTFQAQEKPTILRELERATGDARKRPLVVYLSALGVPLDGKVHLIPGGGRPDKPDTWLALDEVLSSLRRVSSPRLLILDVRPATDPRAVLVSEDVNELLDATLARLAESGDLPFFVLTANTPPGGAAVLRPLKRTAFGLALSQGAGGEADGWNPDRTRDGRVSVRELAAYTRELTHHASTAAGFPPQVPRLHGNGPDFELFTIPRDGSPPRPTLSDAEAYPGWLTAAWTDHDKWVAEDVHLRTPRLFRQLALVSVRAERRWLAGENIDAIRAAFDTAASRLRDIRPTFTPLVQPAGSVVRAQRQPGLNVAAAADSLRPVFNRLYDAPSMERDKALAEAMKPIWEKPLEPAQADAIAVAVFTFAQNLEKPTHDQMKHLATLLGGFKPRPPRHAELLTIATIGGLPPERVEKWPPGTIATLVRVAREAEEAVAIDGRCLPWVSAALTKADETRRNAVRDLCDPNSTMAARRSAAESLEAIGEDYKTVRAAAGALASAFREYEETRAVLVDLAVAFPYEALPLPEVAATTWDALAEDFGKVQLLLRAPTEPRLPDAAELSRAAQSLRAGRERLRSALRVPDDAGVRQCERLLRWPHWSQPERAKLVARLVEAERTAARKVLDGWPKEPPNRDTPTAPPSSGRPMIGDLRRMVTLLRIAEGPDAADLKTQFDRLGPNPTPAVVAELGRKLREAMRPRLAEMSVVANPARQAAIGWLVDPDDVPAFPQQGRAGPPNPEPPERRGAEKEFHEWLAVRRYLSDAALFGASNVKPLQDIAPGYKDIARAYGDAFR